MDIAELEESIKTVTSDRPTVLTLIKTCTDAIKNINDAEPYSDVFKSLLEHQLIDDDVVTQEYKQGTFELYEKLLVAKKECSSIPDAFDFENCTVLSSEHQKMFSSLLVIACTLKNSEYVGMHFSEEQLKILRVLSIAIITLEKHNETFENLRRIGIHSMFGKAQDAGTAGC